MVYFKIYVVCGIPKKKHAHTTFPLVVFLFQEDNVIKREEVEALHRKFEIIKVNRLDYLDVRPETSL